MDFDIPFEKPMKKMSIFDSFSKIIISFLLLLTSYSYGAANDSINLNSNVEPLCSVDFIPEPIASNLDITNSARHLFITKFDINSNTQDSVTHTSNISLDLTETLTHSNTINQFNFDTLEYENITFSDSGIAPFGLIVTPNNNGHQELNLFMMNGFLFLAQLFQF